MRTEMRALIPGLIDRISSRNIKMKLAMKLVLTLALATGVSAFTPRAGETCLAARFWAFETRRPPTSETTPPPPPPAITTTAPNTPSWPVRPGRAFGVRATNTRRTAPIVQADFLQSLFGGLMGGEVGKDEDITTKVRP